MKKTLPLFAFVTLLSGLLLSVSAAETGKNKAQQKRDAMLAQVTDVPGLPRVLLLGDSISMMYTIQVRELLKGKANVHRPPENCFYSANGVKKIDEWLGTGHWDVIHFNFGLHDNNHLDASGKLVDVKVGKIIAEPDEYGKNLQKVVTRLKQTGAVLIFATTTPIPPESLGRVEGAEVAYNDVAEKIMRAEGVQIDDLHAVVVDRKLARLASNNVHYTDASSDQLAAVVAGKIQAALPKK